MQALGRALAVEQLRVAARRRLGLLGRSGREDDPQPGAGSHRDERPGRVAGEKQVGDQDLHRPRPPGERPQRRQRERRHRAGRRGHRRRRHQPLAPSPAAHQLDGEGLHFPAIHRPDANGAAAIAALSTQNETSASKRAAFAGVCVIDAETSATTSTIGATSARCSFMVNNPVRA